MSECASVDAWLAQLPDSLRCVPSPGLGRGVVGIETPFALSDGDELPVFFDTRRACLTDMAETIHRLIAGGVHLGASPWLTPFEIGLQDTDVQFTDGELLVSAPRSATHLINRLQAILRLSERGAAAPWRRRPILREMVKGFLHEEVHVASRAAPCDHCRCPTHVRLLCASRPGVHQDRLDASSMGPERGAGHRGHLEFSPVRLARESAHHAPAPPHAAALRCPGTVGRSVPRHSLGTPKRPRRRPERASRAAAPSCGEARIPRSGRRRAYWDCGERPWCSSRPSAEYPPVAGTASLHGSVSGPRPRRAAGSASPRGSPAWDGAGEL